MSMQVAFYVVIVLMVIVIIAISLITGWLISLLIKYLVDKQEQREDDYESEIDWCKEVIETQNKIIERLGNKGSK